MSKKPARAASAPTWGVTVALAVILFVILTLFISLMAWIGFMGVQTGRISPLFLIERPIIMTLFICIISLTMSMVIMTIVQRLLILPVTQMTRAMQLLAEGKFDTRIHFDMLLPLKEIVIFSNSFNKTAEALGSVEILRSDFINNFSHEFRTPIHALVGIAELLKSGDCSEEETEEYLNTIIDQAKRLASLSTNVLYLTKLETDASPMKLETLNLSELLRQVLVMFDHKCSEKGIGLDAQIGFVELCGSADLLTQMVANILDNAIKFSPSGSTVHVDLCTQGGRAVLRISDHGCGMDDATIQRVFDKFYQGDSSHASEGFGLGLPMVKKIVELHRGRLIVESRMGKGSAFTVELPLTPEADAL